MGDEKNKPSDDDDKCKDGGDHQWEDLIYDTTGDTQWCPKCGDKRDKPTE